MLKLALFTALAWIGTAAWTLAPKPKATTAVLVAVACPETGDCWVKATWKLHPSYNAATDSVRLVWKEGTTNLATRYTDGTADSIAVTRQSVARSGTVTATVWRTGVSQQSPAVSAPWTVPALIAVPEPVDSLKTQVGVVVSPATFSLAVGAVRQMCAHAVYSDGSRELVSGSGCS